MASFPGATVSKPAGITSGQPVLSQEHVDDAWDEIIAVQGVLRGSSGPTTSQIKLIGGAVGVVPLTLQLFAAGTANIIDLGSSAAVDDRAFLTAGGKWTLPVATSTGGIRLATGVEIYTSGTDLRFEPQADATTAFQFLNAAGSSGAAVLDTTNLRAQVGSSTAPPATLSLDTGNARTTAAFGIQFSTDVTLYRSASNVLKTDDALSVALGLTVSAGGITLTAGDFTLGTMVMNVSASGTYTGTGQFTVLAKDFEIRKSNGASRLVLSRPDGTRRAIYLDNDDQIVVEAA